MKKFFGLIDFQIVKIGRKMSWLKTEKKKNETKMSINSKGKKVHETQIKREVKGR